MLTGDRESGIAFARQIVGPDQKVVEPWKSRFEALGRQAKFQEVEIVTLEPWFKRAVALADEYGLRSARGLTFCFNVVIQQGGIRGSRKDSVLNKFAAFRQAQSRDPDEVERMNLMADALSEAAPKTFRPALEMRMRSIANGRGSFHGRSLEAGKHGLGLVDFRTGEAVAVHADGA